MDCESINLRLRRLTLGWFCYLQGVKKKEQTLQLVYLVGNSEKMGVVFIDLKFGRYDYWMWIVSIESEQSLNVELLHIYTISEDGHDAHFFYCLAGGWNVCHVFQVAFNFKYWLQILSIGSI